MRRAVFALALCSALIPSGVTAQAGGGSIATARAIVAAVHMERTRDLMFGQMMPLVVGDTLTAIQTAPTGPAEDVAGFELMASSRVRHFETGMKVIHALYASETGARMLALQPQIQKTLSEQGRAVGMAARTDAIPKALAKVSSMPAPVQ